MSRSESDVAGPVPDESEVGGGGVVDGDGAEDTVGGGGQGTREDSADQPSLADRMAALGNWVGPSGRGGYIYV